MAHCSVPCPWLRVTVKFSVPISAPAGLGFPIRGRFQEARDKGLGTCEVPQGGLGALGAAGRWGGSAVALLPGSQR